MSKCTMVWDRAWVSNMAQHMTMKTVVKSKEFVRVIHSFIHSFIHVIIHSCDPSFIRSFIHLGFVLTCNSSLYKTHRRTFCRLVPNTRKSNRVIKQYAYMPLLTIPHPRYLYRPTASDRPTVRPSIHPSDRPTVPQFVRPSVRASVRCSGSSS